MRSFIYEISDAYASFKIQCRVIYAILMREIITRYGRHNLGYGWMIAEPATFCLGIIAIWSFGHEVGSGRGVDVASFALTGYSTILNWRNIISRCMEAVEPNRSLMFHRNVMVIDVYLARIILEWGGVTLAIAFLYVVFISCGVIRPPADILKMILGWMLLSWYSAGMAMVIGALSEYSGLVEKIWHPLAYFQLPVSGAMVMASWLPRKIRDIELIFPVPNCVELYREGYYGVSVHAIYDIPYVIGFCIVVTWIGLCLIRDVSNRAL